MTFRTLEEIHYEIAGDKLVDWRDDLKSRLPGITDNVLTKELKEVIRQFYTKGQVWVQDLGPYDIKANREDLHLNPVDDSKEVVYIRGVWFKGVPLKMVDRPEDRINTTGTQPYAYYCPYPDVVRFIPIPTANVDDEIIISAVMRPLDPTVLTHQFITSHYYDVILDGALGRLYSMPSKPWSNSQVGIVHTKQFKKGYLAARNDSRRGYVYSSTHRVRFPKWA